MEACSTEVMDNDDAMDFAYLWDDFIFPARERDPDFWTPERIVDFFLKTYLRGRIDFTSSTTAAEILALGALFFENGLPIVPSLKSLLISAASAELQPCKLQKWDHP